MKAEPVAKKPSQADFIRGQGADVPAEKVIELGKKAGFTLTKDRVRIVRSQMGRAVTALTSAVEKKAKRTRRKSKRSSKPSANKELQKKRLAAGRKAAETRRANASGGGSKAAGTPRRRSTVKASSRDQNDKEVEFMNVAVDLGIARSERIIKKIREITKEGI